MSLKDKVNDISYQIKRNNIEYEKYALTEDYKRVRRLGNLSDEQKATFQRKKEDILRRERELDND